MQEFPRGKTEALSLICCRDENVHDGCFGDKQINKEWSMYLGDIL